MADILKIIVEKRDSRGGVFAIQIPYLVEDGVAVIDCVTARGACEICNAAADEYFGGPFPVPARKSSRRRRRPTLSIVGADLVVPPEAG